MWSCRLTYNKSVSLIKASLLSFDLSWVTHQLWVTYFLTDSLFPEKTEAWWFFKQKVAWKGGVSAQVCVGGGALCDLQEERRGRRSLANLKDKVRRGKWALCMACCSWQKTLEPSRLLGSMCLTCSSLPFGLCSKFFSRFHFSMEPLFLLSVSTKSALIQSAFA